MNCDHECKHCGSKLSAKKLSKDVAEGMGCLLWFIGVAIVVLAGGYVAAGFPGLK